MDGQAVSGVPAAGIDQLLSSVEENLPPKAGEEKGRDWGRRVCVGRGGGWSLYINRCKSSQMQDDKFQLLTVRSARLLGDLHGC